MKAVLEFKPMAQWEPGTVADLLVLSYAELLEEELWRGEEEVFIAYDREVFANPDRVGACTFATCLNGELIGLASFDPREGPEWGRIGHNCILPAFRGNGHGKRQILEVLRRLRERGIEKAIVSTSMHPFFLPARRMYLASAFRETRRVAEGPDPRYEMVEYEGPLRD